MKNEDKNEYFHALKIIPENCVGCTNCVRVCPTEALRVRNGIIQLDDTKCIDCGKCIKSCKYNAILPVSDNFESINQFKYKVGIVSSCFAGQFSEYVGYERVREILLSFGFDEIADEAEVTEIESMLIRDYIRNHPDKKPILSSNCPAVVRLIQVKFPSLLDNILHLEAPMSTLTKYYRDKIAREQELPQSDIGIFLIVPCIAQVTAVHQPEGAYKRFQDGAISVKEIGNKILFEVDAEQFEGNIHNELMKGHSWAISGMEADDVGNDEFKTLSVHGIKNVTAILHKIEDHQIEQFDYVVLRSCTNGCVGGDLNIENPFVATSRIKKFINDEKDSDLDKEYFFKLYKKGWFDVLPLEPRSIMELDSNIKEAIKKMKAIRKYENILPGLDCCACGSPSCTALAEDIVQGNASVEDCLVLLRRKTQKSEENK